jgi:hypothetical protein
MGKRKATAAEIEKRRFWKKHIDAWRDGDLSQRQYCREHGLKYHRFIYWKEKFSATKAPSASLVEFSVPEMFRPPLHTQTSALKVAVGDTYKVEVDPGFDPATLKEILFTLGQL